MRYKAISPALRNYGTWLLNNMDQIPLFEKLLAAFFRLN